MPKPCVNLLVLIPARGGSKGIPDKNIREIGGISLVGRSVLMGRRFATLHPVINVRVVVDSDDAAILQEGRRWGAETPYVRPASLAQDHTSTYESTVHMLQCLAEDGFKVDTLLLLQPTSPLRSLAEVCNCWEYRMRSGADSIISVSETAKSPRFAMRLDDEGILFWDTATPPANARRQDFPSAYYPNGSVYIEDVKFLLDNKAFVVAGRTHGVITSRHTSIDVDEEMDLIIANALSNWILNHEPEIAVLSPDISQQSGEAALDVAWADSAAELGRWVSQGVPSTTHLLINGTLGEGDQGYCRSPMLGMWRSLGVGHLTLIIPDARVLDRYRNQLRLADSILAPSELVGQIQALLRVS